MPDRVTIRQEAIRLGGIGFVGTADSVAVGSLTDSDLRNSRHPAETHRDAYIYRPGAGAADQVRTVSAFTNTSGLISHGAANYADTTTLAYELHYALNPEEMNRCIDRALRRLRHRTEVLVSLAADADMEAAGTSSWTATSATLAKNTAAAAIYRGQRSLRVTNTGANGYAASVAIPVVAGHTYYIQAFCRVRSGTARLRVWDITGAAQIAAADSPELGWHVIKLSVTAPSGSRQMEVRLQGVEATADVDWDDVGVLEMGRRRYPLPTWLVRKGQIEDVIARREWGRSPAADRFMGNVPDPSPWPWWDFEEEARGVTPGSVVLNPATNDLLFPFVRAIRAYDALTSETDTTPVDLDWIVAGTLRYALALVRDQAPAEERGQWEGAQQDWARTWGRWSHRYQPRIRRRILPARFE